MDKDDEFLQDSIIGMSGCFEIQIAISLSVSQMRLINDCRDMNLVAAENASAFFFY